MRTDACLTHALHFDPEIVELPIEDAQECQALASGRARGFFLPTRM